MTQPNRPNSLDYKQSSAGKPLMVLRIIWGALMMGPLTFMAVVIFLLQQSTPSPRGPGPGPLLVWVNVIMALTVIPITFVIRASIFRRGRVGDAVAAQAYSTGNILFWAGCEGVAFFALVVAMQNHTLWPTILIVAGALGLQALTFPLSAKMYVAGDDGAQP